jgi:hypothetical protein
MGEHQSQAGRARARRRLRAENPSVLSGPEPGADPGSAKGGGAAPPPVSKSSTPPKPDFRATIGRRLSEERELGPQVLSLISADHSAEGPPPQPGPDPSPADRYVSRVEQRDEFVAELAQAMQAAIGDAHMRIVEELEHRRVAQVGALRGRAAEADGAARDWAEQEIARIERWVEVETQRIKLEGDARVGSRQRELEKRLAQSRTEVDRAVEELDAAVSGHRAAIDAFLVQIAADPDPAKIARLVEALPPVPSFGEIGEGPAAVEGYAAESGGERMVGVTGPRTTPTD